MIALLWAGAAVWVYSYAGYPLLLSLAGATRRRAARPDSLGGRKLPNVSVSLPAYNEAGSIAETLDRVLASDYPRELLQVVVVSDASTDGTDDIVKRYAAHGVELLRLPVRMGKTGGESAARALLRGEVIINTDASVRIHAEAIGLLVAALGDPSVGVASARDVSVDAAAPGSNAGEGAYVGYEMRVRDLETRVGGIVGASGCLYAIRRELHMMELPDGLSRDFGAALRAELAGLRAVSVPDAICFVPRSARMGQEYKRKVRTMARGLRTLWHYRALLDPIHHPRVAWMLWSHKVARWCLPWATALMVAGVLTSMPLRAALATLTVAGAVAAMGMVVTMRRTAAPRWMTVAGFAVVTTVAGLHAWWVACTGPSLARWEPTRRGPATT